MILLYQTHLEKFRNDLLLLYNKYNVRFSITFDGWTASNQNQYLGIIIHYIDNDWIMQSKLIGMEHLEEKHFSTYLLNMLNKCYISYQIENKIFWYVIFFIFLFI